MHVRWNRTASMRQIFSCFQKRKKKSEEAEKSKHYSKNSHSKVHFPKILLTFGI